VEDTASVIPISAGSEAASNGTRRSARRSQRDRIFDALAELCAEKGYPDVTVSDIVARAHISRTTFYGLFHDKEACFLAAYDAVLARFLGNVISACLRPGLSWPEQIRIGLETILSFGAAEPLFTRMCLIDMLSAGPAARERYRSGLRVLASFVDSGRAQAPDGEHVPPGLATSLVGGLALVIRDEIRAGRTNDLPRLLPDLIYPVLVPYVGQDRALAEARASDALATAAVSRG
jgi:AcrR family transcriptional regulator